MTQADISFPHTPFPLAESMLILGRRGSESHGLYIPSTEPDAIDDRDLMGVVVPPVDYYVGLKSWDVTEGINGVWDVVLYELRKFAHLLLKQNPNVLSLLWNDNEDILTATAGGYNLIDERFLFRHAGHARNAFVGYAHGQLKRTTAFNAEAMSRITDLEKRLLEAGVSLKSAAEGKLPDRCGIWLADLVRQYAGQRRTYHKAYMGAKRWKLVQRIGYDAKNAAHMVRILHMGHEYLTEGVVNVRRTWDREMLLEIKRGEWDLGRVKEHGQLWFDKIKETPSVLPESIDEDRVNTLIAEIVCGHHGLYTQGTE